MSRSHLSKRERTIEWLKDHSISLQCIHCKQELIADIEGNLRCSNNHQFDLARQGYYFLAKRAMREKKYDAELFRSRRRVIQELQLYRELHRFIAHYIETRSSNGHPLTVVDLGCGEGSHLYQLVKLLPQQPLQAVGVDLAKSGIQLATDYNADFLPIVGDLAAVPMADRQVDLAISMLSPINYHEVERLLAPGGQMMKIVPNSEYLKEIREVMIYHGWEIEPYSNQDVIEHFLERYPQAQSYSIRDHVSIGDDLGLKEALVAMTPLTWQFDERMKQHIAQNLPSLITLDLTVMMTPPQD